MSNEITGNGHPRFYEYLQRMAAVHSAKNRDYAGETDPLRNLRQCADAGIDPWVGVVVRITDKVDRLKSFARARAFAVKDEGIEDTLVDLANYALLCLILFEEQRGEQERVDHSWADAAVKQDHEPLYYLATPYTKYEGGIEAAFEAAAAITARLVKANLSVYSPIAHTHPVAVHGGIDPLDHSIWLDFDLRMMRGADVLIVAQMQGWRESFGVSQEIKFFQNGGKPILYLNCTTFTFATEPHAEASE